MKYFFLVNTDPRYVFTIADLDTVAPAYDFFMEKLETFCDNQTKITHELLDLDFPQYFCCDKSQEMIFNRT